MTYHLSVDYFFLRHATLSKMVALSMTELQLMVLAGCSCVWLCGPCSLPWNLVFYSCSPLQALKTTLVVLPRCTTCIHVGVASRLPFVSGSFSNSSKMESSVQNNALLQCRYLTLGPTLCLEYLSNPVQIKFLATGMLAANDFHSAFPTPVRLLKYPSCFSWSRWCMCSVILLMCHICCIIAHTSLSSF